MSKKSSLSLIYLIGMALVAIGFVLPVFQFKFLGTHSYNGFDLVGDGDTSMKICTLLIFIGGLAGVLFCFVPGCNNKLFKTIALAVSIIAFVIILVNMMNSDGASVIKGLNLGKKANSAIFKSLYIGAYTIIAGWVIAIIGLVK